MIDLPSASYFLHSGTLILIALNALPVNDSRSISIFSLAEPDVDTRYIRSTSHTEAINEMPSSSIGGKFIFLTVPLVIKIILTSLILSR